MLFIGLGRSLLEQTVPEVLSNQDRDRWITFLFLFLEKKLGHSFFQCRPPDRWRAYRYILFNGCCSSLCLCRVPTLQICLMCLDKWLVCYPRRTVCNLQVCAPDSSPPGSKSALKATRQSGFDFPTKLVINNAVHKRVRCWIDRNENRYDSHVIIEKV